MAMWVAQTSGQVLQYPGGCLPRSCAAHSPDPASTTSTRSASARPTDRQRALDTVLDALSAAMAGDQALCRLRLQQILSFCSARPHAAWAARQEIGRQLGIDIVSRHLHVCDKRRQLRREIEGLADQLRVWAAPLPS